VVGGHDQQVVVAQEGKHVHQPPIEPFEVRGVPGRIVPVPVLRVEVHEVGEDQPAVHTAHLTRDVIHPIVVALGVERGRHPASGEEILDLADGDDGE
jgi:hypothetical protein